VRSTHQQQKARAASAQRPTNKGTTAVINWTTLLMRGRKGALRFPLRIQGHGVVADQTELERKADPRARQEMAALEARAAYLAQALGGPPERWLDVVEGGNALWDGIEQTLRAKQAEPERPFHLGRLSDTVADPNLVPQVRARLDAIARLAGDPTLVPGPDARTVHVRGTIPGTPMPFQGRWAVEPWVLGDFTLAQGLEPRVGVLPTWESFLHATPHKGALLLWPDHGPWSLRRVDWLLEAHTDVWVATRADLEGAARLRAAFGRVAIHLPALPALPREPGTPPSLGLTAAEQGWWMARGTSPLPPSPPPPSFGAACLLGP
jgi:hypothetical protein